MNIAPMHVFVTVFARTVTLEGCGLTTLEVYGLTMLEVYGLTMLEVYGLTMLEVPYERNIIPATNASGSRHDCGHVR